MSFRVTKQGCEEAGLTDFREEKAATYGIKCVNSKSYETCLFALKLAGKFSAKGLAKVTALIFVCHIVSCSLTAC